MHVPKNSGIGKNRIEALADGIFAIAMTLLVLELKVPVLNANQIEELPAKLFALWPKMVSFAISFSVCGVSWVGHNAQLHYVRRSDRNYMWLNILFLMLISAIPFSAALTGDYPFQPISIQIYSLNLIGTGVVLYWQLLYASGRASLLDPQIDPAFVHYAKRRILMGPMVYTLAFLFTWIWLPLSLFLCALVPVLYLLPSRVDLYWKVGPTLNPQPNPEAVCPKEEIPTILPPGQRETSSSKGRNNSV